MMRSHIFVLILFAILTILLTYPLALHMHEAVQEPGDSLFNAWTISWDIKALLKDPLNIFHANIFYPYKYTLAYSEHLIGVALLALPIYLFTKNPLFIYNFMLLLSFILCGWGAYLLIYHLTKDRLAGIVSGIIFSFCPFRFDQFGHLHVLTSQWIPITLLFMHKIGVPRPAEAPRWKNRGRGTLTGQDRPRPHGQGRSLTMWFGFFFFLQFISSGHNGLYLAVAVALFMIYFKVFPWKTLLIVGLLILPFYYPYTYLAREFGFERQLYEFKLHSPQLSSYLAVPSSNWLYGNYLDKFCRPEAVMFPGVVALVLAFWRKIPRIRIKRSIINYLILIDLLVIILIAITGGIDLGKSIFGIKLKVTDFTRPVYILLALLACKINFKTVVRKFVANMGPVQFYWILAILAFWLSFGPKIRAMDKDVMWGPYSLLYNYVPGFKGLRVSGRIYTIFILALAVLAGFGIKRIKGKIRWFFPFIVLAECICIPISLHCWIGTNPSPAYRWLASQPNDSVVIELPMPEWYNMFWHEIQYQYWSLFHGKRLVNGYSGYSPPSYWSIAEKMKDFPNEDAVEILRYLGVRYIVIHEDDLIAWRWPSIVEKMDSYNLRFKEGSDYIYELTDTVPTPVTDVQGPALHIVDINTNYNLKDIYKAIDNDPFTRWHSDKAQEPGMFVEFNLGKIQKVCGISMYFGEAPMDYPRGIEVYVDGQKVSLKHIYADYVKHLLKYPKDNRMMINFEPKEARFIRITQSRRHDVFFWSIYELQIYIVG